MTHRVGTISLLVFTVPMAQMQLLYYFIFLPLSALADKHTAENWDVNFTGKLLGN